MHALLLKGQNSNGIIRGSPCGEVVSPFAPGRNQHALYTEAFVLSLKEKVLPADCKLGRVKYLNNFAATSA
jgi:hypothetical protein